MSKKSMFIILWLPLFAILVSSCAVPTKGGIRTGPIFDEEVVAVDSVGIISDFLILKDASGSDDYYVVEESKLAESRLLEGAKAYLEGKGYGIRYMLSPFVGGLAGFVSRMLG